MLQKLAPVLQSYQYNVLLLNRITARCMMVGSDDIMLGKSE